jgi:hypothetical protein
MTVCGTVVVLSDVPQGLCPACASRVYRAGTLETVERVMRGPAA